MSANLDGTKGCLFRLEDVSLKENVFRAQMVRALSVFFGTVRFFEETLLSFLSPYRGSEVSSPMFQQILP